MGRELSRLDPRRFLAKQSEYEDYVPRAPIVSVWKNDTDKAVFIANPVWDGSVHAKRRVLPGEYHVIDEQRGEMSMNDEMLSLYYTKRPGRKPLKDNDS